MAREEVEKHTVHRFIAMPWTRQVQLVALAEDGTENVLRPVGGDEGSRLRSNKFPYCEAHGISVSTASKVGAGGGSLAMSTADLKNEATKKLGNWWLTDIEKILVEAEVWSLFPPVALANGAKHRFKMRRFRG